MQSDIKQELMTHSVLFIIGAVFGAAYNWLFDLSWWWAIPAGIASIYLLCIAMVILPLIYWGIVGD